MGLRWLDFRVPLCRGGPCPNDSGDQPVVAVGWLEWPSCGQCVVIETIETCLTLRKRACKSSSTSTIVVGFLGRAVWLAWWDSDSEFWGDSSRSQRRDQDSFKDTRCPLLGRTQPCPRLQEGIVQHWLGFCSLLFSPLGGFRK